MQSSAAPAPAPDEHKASLPPLSPQADASPLGWLLTLVGLVVLIVLCLQGWGERLQDDAYISFIYSRNFAQGHGLVYNVGEMPVEGYTNFLWTLGFGLLMKTGVVDPGHSAQIVGTFFAACVVCLTYLLSRRLGASALLGGIAAILIALEPTLTEEALGGLETTFYVTLVLAAILMYLRAPRTKAHELVGSGLFGLATLTRPEAPLYFALFELRELFEAIRSKTGLGNWLKSSFPRWVPFLVLVLGHLSWRYAFYGEILPNTYYAKMTHSDLAWATGTDYVLQGIAFSGVFLFLLPFWQCKQLPKGGGFLALVGLIASLYVWQVGGDFKLSFRYLMIPIVLWGALAASALGALSRTLRANDARFSRALAPILLVVLGGMHVTNERMYKLIDPSKSSRHEQLLAAGKFLNQALPIDARIAVSNAGRIPFFAERRTLDMLGLNDHHIAREPVKPSASTALVGHERGDGKYVLEERPDAILFIASCLMSGPITGIPQWRSVLSQMAFGTSEREIVGNYQFLSLYEVKSAKLPDVTNKNADGSETPVYLNWFQLRAGERK